MFRATLSLAALGLVVGESPSAAAATFERTLQCKPSSYAFCCEFGKACDCTKGVTAEGQCAQASYAFCCSIGAKCDCSQPPVTPVSEEEAASQLALPDPVTAEPETPQALTSAVPDFAPLQCKKASYAFCCAVGIPCDCTKGIIAPGQCKKASYLFCCAVGAKCDCNTPPLEEEEEEEEAPKELQPALPPPEEARPAELVAVPPVHVAQCKASSYAFCCEFGKACDCSKGVTAEGQCAQASYAFCCSVGAKCDCSQPPMANQTAGLVI